MDITVYPGKLRGSLQIIPSKSMAHRMLICAAFADKDTQIICPATNQDIEATACCLNALGAQIVRTDAGYSVTPMKEAPVNATLDCKESGSTLRFMLPIAAALGTDCTFVMSGRLPYRPLSPLWEELQAKGCQLTRPTENTIRCQGKLTAGTYSIDGGVSSQFITGLLFAMILLQGERSLTVTGTVESAPYIRMTQYAMEVFGIKTDNYHFSSNHRFCSPGTVTIEGDWSNGAFFLAANALGSHVQINGLSDCSIQGDRQVADILKEIHSHFVVDGRNIPDLIPILSVVAGAKHGATFHNIGRLRAKESDRIASTVGLLQALGVTVVVEGDTMTVNPKAFNGCTIDSCNDHRIAMSAAIAATVANSPVTILNAHCVQKSYPHFWEEFQRLGGHYEQYDRR